MKKKRLLTKLGRVALAVALISFTNAASADTGYTDDCITFSSEAGFSLNVTEEEKSWNGTLYWSTNKTDWTEWDGSVIVAGINEGSYKLYVRGNEDNTYISNDYSWQLSPVGKNKISCTGNIETLRGATGNNPSQITMESYCYASMFFDCTSLTTAPELPATTLATFCYQTMFFGCTSLTNAPALPATTLATSCYETMFYGCTSLTTAPDLPATNLAEFCYDGMFYDCESLTNAPATLPAETLAENCYAFMFYGCTSLTTAPAALPAETLADSCYSSMFSGCTSLTNAPVLPAEKLANSCYSSMFSGCTSLTIVPDLPATNLANYCYNSMFYGCTSLTTAPNLPATTMAEFCYNFMFYFCNSLVVNTIAPGRKWSLPKDAVTAYYWNNDMFSETGGNFREAPEIGKTYFVESDWKREIDLGGGMKARDYYDGDWAIVGEGELTADQMVILKDEPITNLWIHTGITSVGENAFNDKSFWKLREVTLGTNCTSVGSRAFKQCYGLTNVVTRATDEITFGDYAFSGCHSLEGLSFASTPTFGEGAYSFQTAIYMREGGIPEVYTMPKLTISGKSEHIMGKVALTDDEWTDVTNLSDEEKKDYHFFKVEMQ